jgi:hypothetical protein
MKTTLDANDILREGGPNVLRERFDQAERICEEAAREHNDNDKHRSNGPGNGKSTASGLFPVIDLDDIDPEKEPPWLINGILPATGLSVAYGLPKSGKSFVIIDAVFHVACNRKWAGRAVLAGSVAYCAGEGVSGLKRRLAAFREHYKVKGRRIPFGLIPVAPNLGREIGDDLKLIETLKAWAQDRPPLRAIVIDTLSRSMRGADENSAKDMGVFVDNCENIARAFGCIVIVIHHAGKDADKGARGSIALPAAADVMWFIEKGETSNAVTIVAMKDGHGEGLSWRFRLVPYEIHNPGLAQQGATLSCFVEILDEPTLAQQAQQSRNRKLTDSQNLLLGILRDVITDAGAIVKGDLTVPHNAKAVSREHLKKYLKKRGYWDDDHADNHNRSILSRDLKALAAKKIIGITSEYTWLVS